MKLYISGATNLNVPQFDLSKSLGGLMSSTPVPNGKINSLFSEVSEFTFQNKNPEVVGIFIKNDLQTNIHNLRMKVNYEQGHLFKFEFAVVETNNGAMELIGSRFEEPYYAEWFEPINETLITGLFNRDGILGLWIKRTLINTVEQECKELSNNDESLEKVKIDFIYD